MGGRLTAVLGLLVSVVVGGPVAEPAGAEPEGYGRIKLKRAAISLLIPDSYSTQEWTREFAEQMLENNPSWAESGVTVEQLLSQPLSAGIDLDEDGRPERAIEVVVNPIFDAVPALTDLRQGFTEIGARDIKVERAAVAGHRGFVSNYVRDLTAVDGKNLVIHVTQYGFQNNKGLVFVAFTREPEDDSFGKTVKTVIRSVRNL